MKDLPDNLPLGKVSSYPDRYDAGLLVPIERARTRPGAPSAAAFVGEDVWHGYEFSWLSPRGLPRAAALRFVVDAHSPALVESKSVKLYLNGFGMTRFESADEVRATLARDLSSACGGPVDVSLLTFDALGALARLPGSSLDGLDVAADAYQPAAGLLKLTGESSLIEETLHTDLFRSLCPVTGQPDWASLAIRYRGPPIDRPALLGYLVSYRCHAAFHESAVEQIFADLKRHCRCERLVVAGHFLRRGGLDITPVRADPGETWQSLRLARQ